MTFFNWCKLLIQHTLPSFWEWMRVTPIHFLFEMIKHRFLQDGWVPFWKSSNRFEVRVWSRMYRLGIWINVNVYLFVDKLQGFHQTSCHFLVALKANLIFDVHLDEWALSWPQLHLSFHTWCPESWLQSIGANLHQRACLWIGCETCLPWHWIHLNPNLQMEKVGWSNQTIPCFLLSSSTLFRSWKGSL